MQDAIGTVVTEQPKIDLLYDTLRQWCPGMKHPRFAGGHPVGITAANLGLLQQHRHMVSIKADGTRCMAMFLRVHGKPVAVMHYRNGEFRRLNIRVADSDSLLFDGTLLDIEQMPDRLLVFDVLVLRGRLVVQQRYSQRVRIAEDLLDYICDDVVQLKPVYKPSQMQDIVDDFDSLKNDGLIFTRDEPGTGEYDWLWKRTNCILKWKPVVTIDLYVGTGGVYWGDRGQLAPVRSLFGYTWPAQVDVGGTKGIAKGIHEFEVGIHDKQITLVHQRHRPDVTHPNDVSTVTSNMESVIDNIDFVTLQAMMGQIRVGKRVKYR